MDLKRFRLYVLIVILQGIIAWNGAFPDQACGMEGDAAKEPRRPNLGIEVPGFSLTDYQGREWTEKDFQNSKGMVFVFLGTQCPLAKLYTQRIVEIEKEYRPKGIAFLTVDPNDQDTLAEMKSHAKRYGLEIPFVKDAGQGMADLLGATRTPEACVLDSDRRLVYRGRIDDQYGIGIVRDKVSDPNLRNALDAILAGTKVPESQPSAVGCLIGRRSKKKAESNSPVTFTNQIVRILQKRCVQCHRDGDIGPMALTEYDEVTAWSAMMLEVMKEQRMPPWHAKEGVGHFSNDRRLPPEELALFQEWVLAGSPEGDIKDLPPPLPRVDGWQLSREPDLVVAMSEKPFRVPAQGDVRYQYFRIDPKFAEDRWIEAAEIVPGNRGVVHHILVFAREKGSRAAIDSERGFLFGYVPGTRIEPPIPGYAKRIKKGSELIFQVHYTPTGTPQEDLSKIGFIFADQSKITHEIMTTSAVQVRLNIPPNARRYETSATTPEKLPPCELISMSPHMHLRGKSFRYTALLPNGEREVLLDIPNYDFNWQTEYRLSSLKSMPQGTRIHCDAVFDNSAENPNNPAPEQWVHWGDQTYEEMMIGYFHIAVPIDRETGKPQASLEKVRGERALSAESIFEGLDQNKDNKLTEEEIPARLRPLVKRLDKNSDGILERSELPNR